MAYDLVARLRLIDNMTAPLNKATGGLQSVGKTAMGVGTAIAGVAAAVGAVGAVTSSLDKAMSFESQMDSIASLEKSIAKGTQGYAKMQALALEMGSKTKYSALEAAQGMEELVKAGLSVEQIDAGGGLEAALNLATAGGLDLAEAAEVMSTSLNAYKSNNLSAADAANILAGTANASATDVHDLKYSLAAVSAVADGVGMTFRDTNIALGLFANNGIKGSDAGTSLKTMLSNLQPTTKAQTELMMELGLMTEDGANKFFTASGELQSLDNIAGSLQGSMKGLTSQQRALALETLFGSDAVRAGNILFKEGATGVQAFSTSLEEAPSALEVATAKMDNAEGAVEQFKGALETLQISALLPTLPLIKKVALAAADFTEKLNTWLAGDQAKAWGARITGTFTAVKSVFTGFGKMLSGNMIGGIDDLIQGGFSIDQTVGITAVLKAIVQAVEFTKQAFKTAAPIVQASLQQIGSFLQSLWTAIQPVFSGLGQAIAAVAAKVVEMAPAFLPVRDAIMGFVTTVVNAFMSYWPQIVTTVQTVWSNLQPVFDVLKSALGFIGDAVTMVGDVFAYIWPWVMETVLRVAPKISELIGNISSVISFLIDNVVRPLLPVLGTVLKGTWDVIRPILDLIVKAIEAVIDSINWMAEAWSSAMEGMKNAKQWMSDMGDKAQNVASNLTFGLVPKADGSHSGGLNNVPYDGYTARLHKGERVLTAEENKAYGGGGGSYSFGNIIIQGSSGDPEELADQLMGIIARRVSEAGGQM